MVPERGIGKILTEDGTAMGKAGLAGDKEDECFSEFLCTKIKIS